MNEIVVADDSPTILALVALALRKEGFAPATAVDGEEAIAAVQAHRPKVLIVDAVMPNGDGYEVCRRVREDPDLPKPYIIMLTASPRESDRERAASVGVDEFLTKPFSPGDLRRRVREVIEGP